MPVPHVIPPGTPPAAASPAKPAAPAVRPPAPGKPGIKPDEGGGGLRILTYLRLHWLMIVFCGTLLGAGGAYAAWELLASKYESYALLQVSSVPPTVANQNNPTQARTDFVTYLKTTSALIKSEFVLNAALRDIKDLPTIKAQKDPIKFLDEELMVNWQDGSEVIRITFKSLEPADAKKIVDAVQNAFLKEVVQKDVGQKRIFVQQVEEAMQDMRKLIDRRANEKSGGKSPNAVTQASGETLAPKDAQAPPPKEVAKDTPNALPAIPNPGAVPNPLPPLAPEAPVVPPAPPNANANGNAHPAGGIDIARLDPRTLVNKIGGLTSEIERLPLTINDGKRRLAVLQQKMDAIKDAPISQLTFEMVEKDQDVIVQIIKVKQARSNYEFRASSTTDLNAPGVVQLKLVWEANEAKLKELRKEKAEALERNRRLVEAQKIALEMEDVLRGLQRQHEQLDVAKTLLAKAEKQLSELPMPSSDKNGILQAGGHEPEGYTPEGSILESLDSIYRRLVQQYHLTQMELNSPARVRVLQQGSNPTQKDMKKQVMGTVFAGFMGFGVMILGVLGFEMVAKRVSCLGDVKSNATPLAVAGVIPGQPSELTGRDPGKRAAANEAIDKLRTHVSQTWLARGASTVAVTSATGDEGKAFTAFGLASSLAQSGYRTLLVDFDLRDPQMHTFAGVANAVGVCELLRGEADPRGALQGLASGLHLLTAGKWSDEARKAATGENLETLLNRLRGSYDCVVMHGHALLTAAESVEVARRCEVVLVCALYRETTNPLLKRAAERVVAMEIPHSGVVYVGASDEEALC